MPPGFALWDDRTLPAPVVCATSAWNGLGFNPYQTWAFRRAELTAMSESPFRLDNGSRAVMVSIQTLPRESWGLARLGPVARALVSPLVQRLSPLPRNAPIPVILCLAERFAEDGSPDLAAQRGKLESQVAEQIQAAGLQPLLHSVARGHASLAVALVELGNLLATGKYEAALVGGIDTYYEPSVIEELQRHGRVFDGENLDSFIPGEGGAFLLLSVRNVARRAGWPVLARIDGASAATEPAPMRSDAPLTAVGLTAATRVLCDRLEAEKRKLDWWLSDLTHEGYRVHEFQLAFPRVSPSFPPGSDRVFEPLPPLLGDLGAASMPTAVAIACEAFMRGDPSAANCLVSGSSAGVERGAVLLSRVAAPPSPGAGAQPPAAGAQRPATNAGRPAVGARPSDTHAGRPAIGAQPAVAVPRPPQPPAGGSPPDARGPAEAPAQPPVPEPPRPIVKSKDPMRSVGFFPAQPKRAAPGKADVSPASKDEGEGEKKGGG